MSNTTEIKQLYLQENKETQLHSKRVAKLCVEIGNEYGLNKNLMYTIGLNHDVGKIFIPQRVLKKNSKLSNVERELIDMHAYFGYKLLKNAGYKREICIPILYHHGFDKPKASEIEEKMPTQQELLCANIVAIADIYDALTSSRKYHQKRSSEEALRIMKNEENINQEILNLLIERNFFR